MHNADNVMMACVVLAGAAIIVIISKICPDVSIYLSMYGRPQIFAAVNRHATG